MDKRTIILIFLIILLVLFIIGIGILIIFEYKPKNREILKIEGSSSKILELDKQINIITYNLGYLSLDSSQDFFMDGGKGVMPKDDTNVNKNLKAVKEFIKLQNADIYFLQEVDTNSKRSYYINEYDFLKEEFDGTSSFAYMFKSLFIPYPIFNPVGHVESGNATLNKYDVISSNRIALPSAYKFPKRVVMYKNPILEERIRISNTDSELILYNVHLDAYGVKDGKAKQLDVLIKNMQKEVAKGNYVVAGGDFNQTFPKTDFKKYPLISTDNFFPSLLNDEYLPRNMRFVTDYSKPSSRLLNKPFSGNYEDTQLYIIDGYIVGPNIEVLKVETIDNNFAYSDHHPVEMHIKLKDFDSKK